MMISTKGRYALRLMIDIASREQDGSPVTMRQAAAREDLSVKYLEQLGGALVKAGILKSIRGGSGGYLLAKPPRTSLPATCCAPPRAAAPPWPASRTAPRPVRVAASAWP